MDKGINRSDSQKSGNVNFEQLIKSMIAEINREMLVVLFSKHLSCKTHSTVNLTIPINEALLLLLLIITINDNFKNSVRSQSKEKK